MEHTIIFAFLFLMLMNVGFADGGAAGRGRRWRGVGQLKPDRFAGRNDGHLRREGGVLGRLPQAAVGGRGHHGGERAVGQDHGRVVDGQRKIVQEGRRQGGLVRAEADGRAAAGGRFSFPLPAVMVLKAADGRLFLVYLAGCGLRGVCGCGQRGRLRRGVVVVEGGRETVGSGLRRGGLNQS